MHSKPFEVEIDDHTFTGLYEYEAGEPETDIDPPYPAIATVLFLYIQGYPVECYDIVNPATIQRIEAYLVEQNA